MKKIVLLIIISCLLLCACSQGSGSANGSAEAGKEESVLNKDQNDSDALQEEKSNENNNQKDSLSDKKEIKYLDYLGKSIDIAAAELGDKYEVFDVEGGYTYYYKELGIGFTIGVGEKKIVQIAIGENADIGYGFNGRMTYEELKAVLSNDYNIDLGVPEGDYNEVDCVYTYTVDFQLDGYNFQAEWLGKDPYKERSDAIYIS